MTKGLTRGEQACAARRLARDDGWCILRTNGRRTLALAQSLNKAGIEAWTPSATHKRRLSRRHMGMREIEAPMVPSFVFARSCHLRDLQRVLALPNSPHPSFSIFLHAGRAPVISDREIGRLRSAEEKAKPKARQRTLEIGAKVKPTEGAFAGLTGVVVATSGKDTVLSFGGNLRFNVATWILVGDDVEAPQF